LRAGSANAPYYLYCEWLRQSGEQLRDFPLFFDCLNLFSAASP
jgi:DNA gyrase inhibitor GyrI